MLETKSLTLRAWEPHELLTLITEPANIDRTLGYAVAEGLRNFFVSGEVSPAWLASLRQASGPDPWRHGFFVVHRDSQLVIGTAGFKGPPDAAGVVEIAYGIVPRFEGRGFATEAAAALVGFASDSKDVTTLRAHTLPQSNASTRVLAKCGFHHVGAVVDPEDGDVWRWERAPQSSA